MNKDLYSDFNELEEIDEKELRFLACIYYLNVDVISDMDEKPIKVNRKRAKEILDNEGIIGWNKETNNVIRVLSN